MDLRRLTYFVKVLELGSFTKAAKHLRIAQPALGIQIRKLESELDTQLLIRRSRGVEPTEAGRILADHVNVLLRQVERTSQAMRDYRGTLSGRVAIGAHRIAHFITSALLKRMSTELPTVSLNLTEGGADALMKWVREDRIEIAYSYRRPLPNDDLVFEELLRDDIVVVERATTKKKSKTVPFSEVAGLPLIVPARSRATREHIEAAAAAADLALDVAFEVESDQLAKELVRQNLGFSVMPHASVRHETASGEFLARRIVEPEMSVNLYLVYKELQQLSRPAQAVRNLIIRIVQDENKRWRGV